MTASRRARLGLAATHGWSRCSSALPTRTWPNAWLATASCSWTAGGTKCATSAAWWPGSGVAPASIPDYLALVGDSADGFPGVPGWGAKSTATVLARYGHLENIPGHPIRWDVKVRGAKRLAESLRANRAAAFLFRDLATLRDSAPLFDDVDELEWRGTADGFRGLAGALGAPGLWTRAERLRTSRFGG